MGLAVRRSWYRLALGAAACAGPKPAPVTAATGLDGTWKTDGYGFVLVATGDSLRAYEVTETTCVPSFTGVRRVETPAGTEAVYEADGQVLAVTAGADSSQKHLKSDGAALASRLATSEYLAYSKEARLDPADRTKWTPGQPSTVRPSTRPGFKGPVVELTGPLTISAGETTTQALMGRIPTIVRIGENTQGVFSDGLGRRLPNGWSFGLPNEVFRTADGKTFDGPGIPPDVQVPVFADQDLKSGRDPGLARAVAELRARH